MTRRVPFAALAVFAALGCSKKAPPPAAHDVPAPSAPSSASVAVKSARVADAAPAGTQPLNVLLISIDSLRADMPWAGYDRPITPRLGALHAKSVSYPRAYSTSSFTSKSIPGLLTGRYPSELARTGSFFTKYLAPSDFVCTSLSVEGIPCVGGHAHAYFDKGQSGFESGFALMRSVGDAFVAAYRPIVQRRRFSGTPGGRRRRMGHS